MDKFWLAALTLLLLGLGVMLGRGLRATRRRAPAPAGYIVPAATTEPGWFELEGEIRQIVAGLAPLAKDHGVTFTLALGPCPVARAEPDAFRRALSDLLKHAVSRTPNGSVLVSAGRQGGRVRVVVSDDGPFGDERDARTALHAASEFLASQGGSLEVDNHPGEGMTVTMQLPTAWQIDPDTLPFAAFGQSAPRPA